MQRIWNIKKRDNKLENQLSQNLRVSKILSQLLVNRGIRDPEGASRFLNPKLALLSSPDSLPDLSLALSRIKKAIKNKEKVMIFGDYDVDGLTATALLKSIFKELGLEVIHYLPHRINEGYGLNKGAVKLAKKEGVRLLVTVDCGTNSFEEIAQLKRLDIDVIVTDHHQPICEDLPCALAIINPKRKDSKYGYRDLAGVAVAYKFAQGLTLKPLEEYLDLVCLGTIADVVPLTDENRIIAKEGLSFFSQTKNLGLIALLQQSGMKNSLINATSISYIIAPRINASGRIDTAEVSLKLLLTDSPQEAEELARKVCLLNSQRQGIENRMLKEALDIIEKEINFKEHRVIVVAKEGWHPGVLGIVASKIKDIFHRPTVVISTNDNLCRGSARSINNFHILEALLECKDILAAFGGHQRAAGLSIIKDNIKLFRNRLNHIATERLDLTDLYPCLDIDMELRFSDLDEGLIREIELLEPFGEANPKPIFYTPGLCLKSEPEILNKNTLRCWITDGEFTYKAVGFNMAGLKNRIENCRSFELAYSLHLDKWYDPPNIELEIEDVRLV